MGQQPRPYVYFTVRDILFCRRFKPIDSYKRTSPRRPEAKDLRPRRTPINGVYAAGRLSFHSPFSQMYVRAAAERSLSGTPMYLLLVDAPNHAVPINGMFHARLEPLRAFVSSYPMDGILRNSEKCSHPINGILSDTSSTFTDHPRLCRRKHRNLQHHPCFQAMTNLQPAFADRDATVQVPLAPPLTLLPTASAMPYFLRASDHWTNFFARPSPSCSILTFRRPSFADHPRAFFSSGDYSTALCRTTPTQFDLRKTSVITYKIFFVGLFLLRPYSRLQISRLQIWFVMGAYCFVFPRSICFYVVSSSACIHLKIFLPHLDLFRVLWPCKFLERDTES